MSENKTVDERAFGGVARLAVWTAVWVGTLALAAFLPGALGEYGTVVGWAAIALNLVVGAGWIVAHARFLRGVDDLQRKILQDAMAVALGVGLVGGFAYAAASKSDLIPFDANVGVITTLMGVVYIVATAVGTLRYR